ncbi:aminoglycoside phosphotransferase family protein [Ktedonosporobacter rubrisoli]|uniref:aminoglycoside phosphotransferase family protein n=1 Tax=Ktedonosporobacter rubrisoli TaxID=2509675 RepID=UPI0013EE5A41|nr:aminoglycoside phosphotransferase family protein [Ktedonosporobacter rubrisoli]
MNIVIGGLEEATPDWLTIILSQRGFLLKGKVQALKVTRIHTEQAHSIGYFLAVEYTANTVLEGAPTRLYLKLPKPDADPQNFVKEAQREIRLYQAFMSPQQVLPIIPCYDAIYDPHQQRYHLLLDDLSGTHEQPAWHLTIAEHHMAQTVEALAAFHAYWWNHPQLNNGIGELPTTTSLTQELARLQGLYPRFLENWKDQLSSDDQGIYECLLDALPAFWERRKTLQGQTLIHGDAHFWNFLYPVDPQKHRTYLLDWQTYRISSGTDDLAYTIILRYPHRTKANELGWVKCYHEGLLRHGVTGYSWEQCWHEYRRSTAEQLLVTLNWAGWASNGRYIQRALTGFRDLACNELLHSAW